MARAHADSADLYSPHDLDPASQRPRFVSRGWVARAGASWRYQVAHVTDARGARCPGRSGR